MCRYCKDNHNIRDCTAECRGYCPRNAPSHYPRDCPAYLAKRTNAKAKGKSTAQVIRPPSVVIDSGASDIYLNASFRDSMTNLRQMEPPVSVMLPNGSVEYLTTRATMKGYAVAYAPSFKNSLFSVAKFCDNDNNVFLYYRDENSFFYRAVHARNEVFSSHGMKLPKRTFFIPAG